MTLRLLPLVVLFACTGAAGDSAAGDSAEGAGGEGHPLAPDEYEGSWDIESAGCDGGATIYWAFDGAIDSKGKIAGEETWYWFFSEEGWDADCADTFDISGKTAVDPLSDDPCNTCDRDFTATMELNPDKHGCTQIDGYEQLLDNDEVDRNDEEKYNLVFMLDTNPLGGDPGEAQVWTYVQDDQSANSYLDRSIGLGMFTPDTEGDVAGPGGLTWARSDGMCIEIKEG